MSECFEYVHLIQDSTISSVLAKRYCPIWHRLIGFRVTRIHWVTFWRFAFGALRPEDKSFHENVAWEQQRSVLKRSQT